MTCLRTAVVHRLDRLTTVLIDLQGRVRAAVASELGKAVGDAVRDLVAAAVRHPPGAPAEGDPSLQPPRHRRRSAHDPWDEDDDEGPESWDDGDEHPCPVRPIHDGRDGSDRTADPPASNWAAAAALGVGVARRVVAGRGPLWVGVLAGGLVLLGTLAGGPVLRAAAAVVHAAGELVPYARLAPPPF